jgi:hypothetical protein
MSRIEKVLLFASMALFLATGLFPWLLLAAQVQQ